jgi:undecaprenyl-diphosphatase
MGELPIWLLLGLIQGLTDIFPISSTGHLAIFRQVLNAMSFNLSLAAGLHSGSLIAIALFFRQELKELWKDLLRSLQVIRRQNTNINRALIDSPENLTPYLLVLSLIPVAVEGLIFRQTAQTVFNHKTLPVFLLFLNGAFILFTTLFARGERTIKELTWKEFLCIGLIQGIAVLPGISRLGLVLCTGLLQRLKWQEAIKLTFILSIPVVIGALTVETGNILDTLQNNPTLIASFLVGNLIAGLGSWYSLRILTSKLLERSKLALFGYYCLMLSTFSFTYLYFWN